MRFLRDGPSIPDELLVARDEGRVIFFCGAGVSRARAALPDFFGLAQKVVDALGVEVDASARKLIKEATEIEERTGVGGIISADRIFSLLERDFLAADIQAAVAGVLKPAPDVDLSAHRTIIDLSRGPDGSTRLVTTNFDLLFEACDSAVPYWKPPTLPDPSRSEHFVGIIHLHGHVDQEYKTAAGDGLVLSSSEFGRAYLSDGWATRFISTVLDRYLVVFLGYGADDPPVQYLLEALNRTLSSRGGVYAFQSGSVAYAQSRWLHKGVQPIPYDPAANHAVLWATLDSWAVRARNPDAWYVNTIAMARQTPEALLPYQRGQVAHIVSTLSGARKFSAVDEAPAAEWLCVFDPLIRYERPGHLGSLGERGPYFDPFEAYGLDSDPVPPPIDPNDHYTKREVPSDAWNCFTLTQHDRHNLPEDNFAGLRGHLAINVPRLSPRLLALGVWLAKISDQVAAVWWSVGQHGIHPNIQDIIRWSLRTNKGASAEIRKVWNHILESWATRKDSGGVPWYELKQAIERDGWSQSTIREFILLNRPYLTVRRPFVGGPKPPENNPDLAAHDLVYLDVEYPEHHDSIQVPDEHLVAVTRGLRQNLEHAIALETEQGGYGFSHVCPIEPDPQLEKNSSDREYGISRLFLAYVEFVKNLLAMDIAVAKREYLTWWPNEDVVFARLRIWAAGDGRLLSNTEAGKLISGLNDHVFWDLYHQRDLLLTLLRRWNGLSVSARRKIERRLLRGRRRWKWEKKEDYLERRAWLSLDRIFWLLDHGCSFTFDVTRETAALRELSPGWEREHSREAASSMEARAGFVRTDTDYAPLIGEPLDRILAKAEALTGIQHIKLLENDPFAGLAKGKPVRAFAALSNAAKQGKYPDWAWRTFLNSERRKADKAKFSALIAERLSRLPEAAIVPLIHPISDWLLRSSSILLKDFPDQFAKLWAKLIGFLTSERTLGKSAIIRYDRSSEWATEALNAPAGKLAQALMNDPQKNNLQASKGFPHNWIRQVDTLLLLPGDARRHALVIFSFNLNWFFWVDPVWTEKHLIALLNQTGEDQDAIWAGFLWGAGRNQPTPSLFLRIKPYLIELARQQRLSRHDYTQVVAGLLLSGWRAVDSGTHERLVNDAEMRDALTDGGDGFRGQILWYVEKWPKEDGSIAELLEFLTQVWPRHKKAKTPKTSARLSDLAFSNAEKFPDIANAIEPLLTRIDIGYPTLLHLLHSEERDRIVNKWPAKVLSLLSIILPEKLSALPYDFGDMLERISRADPSLLNDKQLIDLKRRWDAR